MSATGRIAVLASGGGSNLQALIDQGGASTIALVIVNNPKAGAIHRAEKHGLACRLIDHRDFNERDDFDHAIADALDEAKVDWVALAGFMRILGRPVLDRYGGRIVNIHPSLLPAFKGLHAQSQAFEYGAKIAGCTVHLVDAGVDTGPILAQAALQVLPQDTAKTLATRILSLEHQLFPAVMASLSREGLVRDEEGKVQLATPLGLHREDALISP